SSTPLSTSAPTPAAALARTVVVVESPISASGNMAEEYAHVRRDLARIALFGGLIFAGMVAIKLGTGL
ncbi:MAG: hypothetical protein H0T73_19625, partial [Ardenticatenales bacterium]|nr:hypothetical protein [Ardenticatenales bacterium]